MTDEMEKLRGDFAYVREALDRQRQLACDRLPPWLAAVVAAFLMVMSGIREFASDDMSKPLALFLTLGIIMVVIIAEKRRRQSRPRKSPRISKAARFHLLLPWLGMFAGVLTLVAASVFLDIPNDVFRIATLLLVATNMISVGATGIPVMLGFGGGAILAALTLALQPPFHNLALGFLIGGGMLAGAWVDRRSRGRA